MDVLRRFRFSFCRQVPGENVRTMSDPGRVTAARQKDEPTAREVFVVAEEEKLDWNVSHSEENLRAYAGRVPRAPWLRRPQREGSANNEQLDSGERRSSSALAVPEHQSTLRVLRHPCVGSQRKRSLAAECPYSKFRKSLAAPTSSPRWHSADNLGWLSGLPSLLVAHAWIGSNRIRPESTSPPRRGSCSSSTLYTRKCRTSVGRCPQKLGENAGMVANSSKPFNDLETIQRRLPAPGYN